MSKTDEQIAAEIDRLHAQGALRAVTPEGLRFEIQVNGRESIARGLKLKLGASWPLGYAHKEDRKKRSPFYVFSYEELFAWFAQLTIDA